MKTADVAPRETTTITWVCIPFVNRRVAGANVGRVAGDPRALRRLARLPATTV
jgi:hypothetical protein